MTVTIPRTALLVLAVLCMAVSCFMLGRVTAAPAGQPVPGSRGYAPRLQTAAPSSSPGGCPEYSQDHPFCGSKPGAG
jgi:hypothetical protein